MFLSLHDEEVSFTHLEGHEQLGQDALLARDRIIYGFYKPYHGNVRIPVQTLRKIKLERKVPTPAENYSQLQQHFD